ncbi:MAG: trypsin-like peptidase domain-containing protein [Candidatus Uhrbacteria bacterium]|nr:trypsin-like peptidase domain-containing protein [Candidatus Uhrbacteria bacterium]
MSLFKKELLKEGDNRSFLVGLLGGVCGSVMTFVLVFIVMHTMISRFQPLFNSVSRPISSLPMFAGTKELSKNVSKNVKQSQDSAGFQHSPDVSDIVAKVNPAVVSIVISKDVPVMEQYFVNPFGSNSPFGNVQIPQYRQHGTQSKEVGGGSGFIISTDGYIVSNAHVVNDPNAKYTVFLNGGKKYDAQVTALDDTLDIALLKIDAKDLPYVEFGNSDQLKLGQSVIAIGNALGEFRNTVSTGVVSGLARSITAQDGQGSENLDNLIQTDAAINPGNSGGPLLNLDGQVVGVDVAIAQGSENVGFALPINMIKSSIESMKTNGRSIHPFLGIRYIPITADLQKQNHLSVDYGILVVRGEQQTDLAVVPGSPANKAGIVEYDIILEADGKKIDADHPLTTLMRQKKVGDQLKLKVVHGGVQKDVVVTLEEAK